MELIAAAMIPLTVIFLMFVFQRPFGFLLLFSFVPMCLLLCLGGTYWRGKLAAIDGDQQKLSIAVGWCRIMQWPAFLLALIACVAVVAELLGCLDAARSGDELVAAIACSLLAAAEYVNYYHRQLQHFDHLPDWLRLLRGAGLRRSHLARDMRRSRLRR